MGDSFSPASFGPGFGPKFRTRGAFPTPLAVSSVTPNSGRTASQVAVTITGRNFIGASDGSAPVVLFGTDPATNVVIVDRQTITCNAPFVADPESNVDITVTIGSQSAIGAGLFTLFESVITSVSPSHGAIDGETAVVIEGYNFVEGSLVYFDDELAIDIVVIDSRHITCVTPPHATGFVNIIIVEPL